ncbi:MAG: hypothetical protein AAF228_13755 [Pseudomonadota bacterium]
MEPTQIYQQLKEIEDQLGAYGLNKDKLVEVAKRAIAAGRDATPNHPSNAPGTFSYQEGTRALRDLFLNEDWTRDSKDGIESIYNKSLNIKVVFQNVDIACDIDRLPKSRSAKGKGSERACEGNLSSLFDNLPHFASLQAPELVKTFYLMVSENGTDVRVELSRPVIINNTFSSYIERIFIVKEGEWESAVIEPMLDDNSIPDFDVEVTRKT